MSNYSQKAINPKTGKQEVAEFLDDYFGKHRYGVKFSDEEIYHAEDIDKEKGRTCGDCGNPSKGCCFDLNHTHIVCECPQGFSPPTCLHCGRELQPHLESLNDITGEWDEHSFICECLPDKVLIIG